MEKEEAKRQRNVQLREFFYGVLLFVVLIAAQAALTRFGGPVGYSGDILRLVVSVAIYLLLLVLVAFYLKKPRVALGGAVPLVLAFFGALEVFASIANTIYKLLSHPVHFFSTIPFYTIASSLLDPLTGC